MMDGLWLSLATNTVLAGLLASLAWLVDRRFGRPAFAHTLYVIALLALVTPPLVRLEGWAPAFVQPEAVAAEGSRTPPDAADSRPDSGSTARQGATVASRQARPEAGVLRREDPHREGRRPAGSLREDPQHGEAPNPQTAVPWTPVPWPTLLLAVWLAGSVATLALLVLRYRGAVKLLATGRPLGADDAAELTVRASEAGLRRVPGAVRVDAPVSPALLPTWRGAHLLLPDDWSVRFDARSRRALLRHECAHLRRGDHRLRLLEALVTVLVWWHPLLWLVRAGLRDAEERACDAWVVAGADVGARRSYCEALISAASVLPARSELPAALTTGAVRTPTRSPRVRAWARRLENAMNRETPFRAGPAERALACVAVLAFLPFGIAQDPVASTRVDLPTHLEQTRFAWAVEDAALSDWAADLQRRIGRPVDVGRAALELPTADTRLTGLALPETSARRVLDVVSALTDLRWNAVEGRVVIEARASVAEPAGDYVHVLGAVRDPGRVPLRGEGTVLELLSQVALAEGADISAVRLIRTGPREVSGAGAGGATGQGTVRPRSLLGSAELAPLCLTIDVRGMIERGDTSRNVVLQAGDFVSIGFEHPELPELVLRVGSRLHFVVDPLLRNEAGMEQLELLSQSQAVGRDGTVFVPYVGPVHVLGLDRNELSDLVSQLLDQVFVASVRVEARFEAPK